MFLSLYDEVKNVLCLSLLSRDRYQYDSLIVSKQTWAYPVNTCNSCCDVKGADVTKECLGTNFNLSSTLLRKLCVHYANGSDNVESAYLVYSNPLYIHIYFTKLYIYMGHPVAQLVEALCYKPKVCGFEFRWCHWTFFIYEILPATLLSSDWLASNRNEYQE
jgi:hypothetical protein